MRFIKKGHTPRELQVFNAANPGASYKELYDYSIVDENNEPVLDRGEEQLQLNNIVREALAKEQGYICCYCMKNLRDKAGNLKMVIEHFKPKGIYDGQDGKLDLRTEYSNLLGSCKNDGSESNDYGHCDARKSQYELFSIENPSSQLFKDGYRTFYYNGRGKVFSTNDSINKEIGELLDDGTICVNRNINKLNLNHRHLQTVRQGRWNNVRNHIVQKIYKNTKGWDVNKRYWGEALKKYRKQALVFAKEQLEDYKSLKTDGSYYPFCEMIIFLLEKKFRELKQS